MAATSAVAIANDTYGRGYTIIQDQSAKLNIGIHQTITFSNNCGETVLDVLAYALEGTGYVLAPPSVSDPDIIYLYNQPKPAQLSSLGGTYTLSTFLQALGGDGWTLVHDPIRRTISYRPAAVFNEASDRFVKVSND